MKTFYCLLISSAMLINHINAQSVGITGGATFASYKASVENVSVTSDTKTGFNAGLVFSIPLSKSISFRPELKYVQKGGSMNDEGFSDKMTLNYIELPLDFVFNKGTSRGMFFVGAGPSLSIGLSGKDKWDDGYESGTDDIKFGSGDDDDLKSFEVGINILAGYQFSNGFFVSANYNAGLTSLVPGDAEMDSKYHNRYFGINIGFMILHKSKPAPASN